MIKWINSEEVTSIHPSYFLCQCSLWSYWSALVTYVFEVLYWRLLVCNDILGESNYAAYTVAEFKLGRDDRKVKLLRETVRKPVDCVRFIKVIMIRGQWPIFTNDKNSIVEFVWQTLMITLALNLEVYTRKRLENSRY
jgi:hypothetical protein